MKIAIIGASKRRQKFGNKCVRAYQENGDTVFPVHPADEEVEGLKAFRSVLEVPDEIEVASFYVAPEAGLKVLEECAQKKIPTVWLNPGSESDAVLTRARELGIETQTLCSIRHIGRSPSEFS